MVIVIARFRPRADRRDDFVALLEGCLHDGYYSEISDPLSFIAVEEWRDEEALAAHLGQPHIARLIAALPELGDGRPEIAAHQVAGGGPLPLPG